MATLLDTSDRMTDAQYCGRAASSGGGSGGSVSSSETGISRSPNPMIPGQVVFRDVATGEWAHALASTEAYSGPVEIGIAVTPTTGAGQSFTIFRRGLMTVSGWGLTPGVCYVSETLSGGVQTTATTTAGHVGRIVGWARDTETMYVEPSPDWVVQ